MGEVISMEERRINRIIQKISDQIPATLEMEAEETAVCHELRTIMSAVTMDKVFLVLENEEEPGDYHYMKMPHDGEDILPEISYVTEEEFDELLAIIKRMNPVVHENRMHAVAGCEGITVERYEALANPYLTKEELENELRAGTEEHPGSGTEGGADEGPTGDEAGRGDKA